MQWTLTEEQESYQATLREWLADVAPPATVRGWLDEHDQAGFEGRFVRDGWSGVGLAEEAGGQGGGVVELALTAEELGRAGVPGSAWLATVLAAPALDGRPELLEAALGGAPVALLAPAEAVPATAPALSVDAEGRVSGEVARVLAGDRAASYVVVVEGPDGEGAGGRTLRLVEAGADGVTVSPRRLLDRSRSVADVRLDSVASQPLDVDAAEVLARCTDLAGVLVAADSLGATEQMLDLSVAYSLQRHQFGVPIGSFQAVKHAAATILVGVEAARSAIYYAAASVDSRGPDHALHAAAVKAQTTAHGARAADSALTMHGAIGYTWEHDLHLFYKRARLDEHLFGAPEAWNDRIADALALV